MYNFENNEYKSSKFLCVNTVLYQILLNITAPINIKKSIARDERIKELLQFQKLGEDKKLESCINAIEDTECAFMEFYTHGLNTREDNQESERGEKYLRLYGVLNAFYIQMFAIIELMNLFDSSKSKECRTQLQSLKLHDIRNKLGSHTLNYDNNGKKTTLKLSYYTLEKWGESIFIFDENDKSEEINLIDSLNEYNKLSEKWIKHICEKVISRLLVKKTDYKTGIIKNFEYIKNRQFDYIIYTHSRND